MSQPTAIEREHYAKLIGRQITAISNARHVQIAAAGMQAVIPSNRTARF